MTTAYWITAGVVAAFTLLGLAVPREVKDKVNAKDNWATGTGRAIGFGINIVVIVLLIHAARSLS